MVDHLRLIFSVLAFAGRDEPILRASGDKMRSPSRSLRALGVPLLGRAGRRGQQKSNSQFDGDRRRWGGKSCARVGKLHEFNIEP